MQEPLWVLLLKVLGGPVMSGLIAAGIMSVVTYWLSRRGFIEKRWWERKADMYTRIVGTLVDMEYSLESWIDFGQQLKSPPDLDEGQQLKSLPDLDEGQVDRLLNRLRKEHDESEERIRRSVIEGDFVITRKAATVLSELLEGYPEYLERLNDYDTEHETYWDETYDEIMDLLRGRRRAVESCLESLRAEAKSDLRVKDRVSLGWRQNVVNAISGIVAGHGSPA